MKSGFITASALLSATATLAAVTPVTVDGNAFFAGDERFYIRGLDYQPGGAAGADTESGVADPIADVDGCRRDVAYFKQLGINTIRVYSVDNRANHDECMSMLEDAGIYLALDVNTPDYAINRDDPWVSYNSAYLQSVFATIDAFADYPNTLLFFSGNEIINTPRNSDTAPYIKAVIRDMRQYIRSRGYRSIPVGYSAADVSENREQTAQYLNCGTPDERSDFFAFNDYSWCDPSTFERSGWSEKVRTYSSYSIPLFLSEYGCIEGNRNFQEVPTLYGEQMTPVYSGGLVYEYTEEGTGYGIAKLNGNQIQTEPDFDALAAAFKRTPNASGDGGYKTNGSPSECPARSNNWQVMNNTLPAIPEAASQYMVDGPGRGPGLNGPGSMFLGAGDQSPGWAQPGSGSGTPAGSPGPDGSDGAAASLRVPDMSVAPLVCGAVVIVSSLFGAASIF